MYEDHLKGEYDRHGAQVLPHGGTHPSVTDLLRQYCGSHDRLTLAELVEYESHVGQVSSGRARSIAIECMVRVGADEFASPALVGFSTPATDKAISFLMGNGSVASVSRLAASASLPPLSVFVWNPHLLQSFCEKASNDFQYLRAPRARTDSGVVCRRDARISSYQDALAHALAESACERLDVDTAKGFLSDAGYWFNGENLALLAEQAKALRRTEDRAHVSM